MTDSSTHAAGLDEAAKSAALRVIFFTVFLDILGFGIIIPQLGVYATQFGATPFLAGLLASSYSAMGFLSMPFWGRLSDRIGRRPVLLYSIFGTSVGYVFFALAGSLPWLFAARIVDGITGGNISTAQAYVADITEPEKRSKTFAMFGAVFGVGFALGPAIGWLLSHLPGAWGGNLGLGAFSAGLSLLNWLLAVKFLPETLSSQIREDNKAKDENKRVYFNWKGFEHALSIPNLNIVIVIGFLATTAFATMQGTYALFIIRQYARPAVQAQIYRAPGEAIKQAEELSKSQRQVSVTATEGGEAGELGGALNEPYPVSLGGDFAPKDLAPPKDMTWREVEKSLVRPQATHMVGIIFTVIGFLSILVQGGLMRTLPKRVGEVNLVMAGTFIMAAGLAFVPLPHQFWGQYLVAALLTLGNGLSTPVLSSLVSQLSPEAERGEIIGVFQSTQSLGRIFGPLIAGTLFNLGKPSTPFEVGGLIMLAAFFLAFKLRACDPGRQEECLQVAAETEGKSAAI